MKNIKHCAIIFIFFIIIGVYGLYNLNFFHKPSSNQNIPPSPPQNVKSKYSWHTNIISTTFWIGEIYNENLEDGSQVFSTYDSKWAYHYSESGCDGAIKENNEKIICHTETRTKSNGYFPTKFIPKENPFYLDLPYDDINDPIAFRERCQNIPWAKDYGYVGHCADENFSYMKNRWVKIIGPNGNTCYGQIEDAGPSYGNLYHDAEYVFGVKDTRPIQKQFNNAGMDVSPALNACLGFTQLDGQDDKVSWQFVDDASVPDGPWKRIITTSQVTL